LGYQAIIIVPAKTKASKLGRIYFSNERVEANVKENGT
jgi:hypothetical protein